MEYLLMNMSRFLTKISRFNDDYRSLPVGQKAEVPIASEKDTSRHASGQFRFLSLQHEAGHQQRAPAI